MQVKYHLGHFVREVFERFLDHQNPFKVEVDVGIVNEVFENLVDKLSVLKVLEAQFLF